MERLLSNNWSIVLLVGIALSMVIGASQYRMSSGLRIQKAFSDRMFSLVGKVFGIAVAVMAAFESTAGILQVLDKYLGGVKNDAWSLLLFPIAVAVIAVVVWAIVAVAGIVMSRIKRAGLVSIRKDVIKRRQRNAEKRYQNALKKFEDIEAYKARKRVG